MDDPVKQEQYNAKTLTALTDIIDTSRMKAPAFCMVLTGVGDFAYNRPDGNCVKPQDLVDPTGVNAFGAIDS